MTDFKLPEFIPSATLKPAGPVSKAFLNVGAKTFYDAASWAYRLPYGRNSDRSDYMLIDDIMMALFVKES